MHQKLWLNKVALIAWLVMAAALLVACGGGSGGASSVDAASSSRPSPRCQHQLAGLLAALDTMRGRLVGELEYPEYVHAVSQLEAAYGRTSFAGLPRACLEGPAVLAERAVNRYIGAADTWARCMAKRNCEPESARPRVAKQWWAAGLMVSKLHSQVPGKDSYRAGLPIPPP